MTINTTYDIGETVFFKCIRGKEPEYIYGEIVRISVYKSKDAYNIRYTVKYHYYGETLTTDRWEDDLVKEDLTGAAMPRLYQVVLPSKEET